METSGERLMHQHFPEQEHDSPLFCLPSLACVCLFHMCFILTSLTWTSKGPREGTTVRKGRSRLCGTFFARLHTRVQVHAVHRMMTFATIVCLAQTVCAGQSGWSETPRCHMQSARRSPQGEPVQDEHLTWLGPCFLGDHCRSALPNLQISAVTDTASPSSLNRNDGDGLCINLAPNQNDLERISPVDYLHAADK